MNGEYMLVPGRTRTLKTGIEDESQPAGLPVTVAGRWDLHAFGLIIFKWLPICQDILLLRALFPAGHE
jgi:hypothetical protein